MIGGRAGSSTRRAVLSCTAVPSSTVAAGQQHEHGSGSTGSSSSRGVEFAGLGLWGFVEAGCLAYVILHYFLASSVMVRS